MPNVIGAVIKCYGSKNHFCVYFKHGIMFIFNCLKKTILLYLHIFIFLAYHFLRFSGHFASFTLSLLLISLCIY